MVTVIKLQFELPEKRISLSRDEFAAFVRYLLCCESEAFTGINNFHRLYPVREDLLKFSLLTLLKKAVPKCYNGNAGKVKISVNQAEELTLRTVFQRVEQDSFVLALQEFILRQLQSTYRAAKVKRKLNGKWYGSRTA